MAHCSFKATYTQKQPLLCDLNKTPNLSASQREILICANQISVVFDCGNYRRPQRQRGFYPVTKECEEGWLPDEPEELEANTQHKNDSETT